MTTPKDTGGAAFPILRDWRRLPDFVTEEGMTLRDHFAGLALITATGTPKQIAKLAYEIADEMLEERKDTLQEAPYRSLYEVTGDIKDLNTMLVPRTALAQQGEPVAWTHSCNALCTDGLELWIDHCPHCGKPRTAHAEQWPPGLITDIVLTVTALHKEVDIGWSPDARSHLSRLSTSIEMLAAAPAPAPVAQQREQQPVCHGCGIPAGDVHMSTCKSGKWPSRVSASDTAAPAPQVQECTRSHPHELMDGYCGLRTEIARLTNENARLEAAPQAQDGRYIIAGSVWFRKSTNEWVLELSGSINDTSFVSRHTQPAETLPENVPSLSTLYAPAPQAQDALQDIAAYIGVGGYNGATTEQLSERIRVEFDRLAALQSAQPVAQPRDLTDEEILSLEKQTPAMNDAGEEWIYFARAVLKKARE